MNNLDFKGIKKYVIKNNKMPDNISINLLNEEEIIEIMNIIPNVFDNLSYNNITPKIWLLAGKLSPYEYLEIIPEEYITKKYILSIVKKDYNIIKILTPYQLSFITKEILNIIDLKNIDDDIWENIISILPNKKSINDYILKYIPEEYKKLFYNKKLKQNLLENKKEIIPTKYVDYEIIDLILDNNPNSFLDYFEDNIFEIEEYAKYILNKYPNLIREVPTNVIKKLDDELINKIYNFNANNYKYIPYSKLTDKILLDYALYHEYSEIFKLPDSCYKIMTYRDCIQLRNVNMNIYLKKAPLNLITREDFNYIIESGYINSNSENLSRIAEKFVNQVIFDNYPSLFLKNDKIIETYINENNFKSIIKLGLSNINIKYIKKYIDVIKKELINNNMDEIQFRELIDMNVFSKEEIIDLIIKNPDLTTSLNISNMDINTINQLIDENPNILIPLFKIINNSNINFDPNMFIKKYVNLYSKLDNADFNYIPQEYLTSDIFKNIYNNNPRSIYNLDISLFTDKFFKIAAECGVTIRSVKNTEEVKQIAKYNKAVLAKIDKFKQNFDFVNKYFDYISDYLKGNCLGIEFFCRENKIPVQEFKKALAFLKENIPDIEQVFNNLSDTHRKEAWDFISNITLECVEGINNGVECPESGKITSFNPIYYFLLTDANPNKIYEAIKKENISARKVIDFKRKIVENSEENLEDIENYLQTKFSYNNIQKVLTYEEKENVVKFLKNNNIPLNLHNLFYVTDFYAYGDIDINKIYKKKYLYEDFETKKDTINEKIETIKFQEIAIKCLEEKLNNLNGQVKKIKGGSLNV